MKKSILFFASLLTLALAMVACGKKDDGGNPAAACPANMLATNVGCVTVINPMTNQACQPGGYVYYGGYCQNPATLTNYGYGGANGGSCSTGYVYTQYGCLAQSSCGVGQGLHPQYGCVSASYTGGSQWPYPTTTNYPTGYPPGYGYQYGYPSYGYSSNYRMRCSYGFCWWVAY